MPRPTYWPFLPYPHLGATFGSIDDGSSFVGTGAYAALVSPLKFMLGSKRALHYLFNRVAKWDLSIRVKINCPNTVNGEYQTLLILATWDRTITFADEMDLHRQPQALTETVNGPGRDFYILEGPDIMDMEINGTNVLTRGDHSGIIDTSVAPFHFYFGGWAYVGLPATTDAFAPNLWDPATFRGNVMADCRVEGADWVTTNEVTVGPIDHFVGDSWDSIGLQNTLRFDGDAEGTEEEEITTSFRLIGDLAGGIVAEGYDTQPLQPDGQDYMVIATPKEWYPYKDADENPKYDTVTGSLV